MIDSKLLIAKYSKQMTYTAPWGRPHSVRGPSASTICPGNGSASFARFSRCRTKCQRTDGWG